MGKSKKVTTPTDQWEEICKEKGISTEVPMDVTRLPKTEQNFHIASYKLGIIIARNNQLANNNQVWIPDYTDMSQWKYELWLKVIADKSRPSGFGLSYDGYGCWYTFTGVGVRFAFINKQTGIDTFEKNKHLFEQMILKIED